MKLGEVWSTLEGCIENILLAGGRKHLRCTPHTQGLGCEGGDTDRQGTWVLPGGVLRRAGGADGPGSPDYQRGRGRDWGWGWGCVMCLSGVA